MLETINIIREAEEKAAQIVADAAAEAKQRKYDANVEGKNIIENSKKMASAKAEEIIANAERRVEIMVSQENESVKTECEQLEKNAAPAVSRASDFIVEKLAGNL